MISTKRYKNGRSSDSSPPLAVCYVIPLMFGVASRPCRARLDVGPNRRLTNRSWLRNQWQHRPPEGPIICFSAQRSTIPLRLYPQHFDPASALHGGHIQHVLWSRRRGEWVQVGRDRTEQWSQRPYGVPCCSELRHPERGQLPWTQHLLAFSDACKGFSSHRTFDVWLTWALS